MPARYRIDTSLGVIFSTGEGALTEDDILTHGKRLREDPDFDPKYNQLIDVRGASEIGLSVDEMTKIANLEDIFSEQSRRAIVAETDFKFGMGRMFGLFSDSSRGNIKVFRDMDEARRWLGLD